MLCLFGSFSLFLTSSFHVVSNVYLFFVQFSSLFHLFWINLVCSSVVFCLLFCFWFFLLFRFFVSFFCCFCFFTSFSFSFLVMLKKKFLDLAFLFAETQSKIEIIGPPGLIDYTLASRYYVWWYFSFISFSLFFRFLFSFNCFSALLFAFFKEKGKENKRTRKRKKTESNPNEKKLFRKEITKKKREEKK